MRDDIFALVIMGHERSTPVQRLPARFSFQGQSLGLTSPSPGLHVVVAELLPLVSRQESLIAPGELGRSAELLLRDVGLIAVQSGVVGRWCINRLSY